MNDARADPKKEEILIVDDKPANLGVLIKILDSQGYIVHAASESVRGLQLAETIAPDLILLDIMMPVMDGYEICKQLKANERTCDIPVIFISAADQLLDKVTAFSIGGVDYITKPFQLEEVLARIRTHLSLQKLRKSLAERVQDRTRELEETNAKLRGEIADRRRSEEALRISEERYRALYRDNPTMFFTLDTDARIISVNEFGASQLGYTIHELEGQSVLKVFYEPDRQAVTEQFQACLQKPQQVLHWQFRKIRKDGSMLWVEEFARSVIGPSGKTNVLVVCQDITGRKQAEAQQLELVLAQQRAETLKEILDTLSHDLKTPLTVINTSLYLLEKAPEPENQKRKLEQIKAQVQRLERLIQDILTISYFDSIPRMDFQRLNLNHLISRIREQFQVLLEERHITFDLDFDQDLWPIPVSEVNILRALINLIENAVHYTLPEGTITVRTSRTAAWAVVEVCDTGIGIDAHDLPHIFEHFYRADKARATHQGGTGLGLTIVKKIVDMHKGEIEVESTLGNGSIFRIRLPSG